MKKKKLIAVGVVIIVLTPLLVILIGGNQGFLDLYRTHREFKKRAGEISAARMTIDSLTVERERLMKDTSYIERIAREKLGMARTDEKIYKFVEENE